MYCQNCAAIVDDNAVRCPKCGAAINRPGSSRSIPEPIQPMEAMMRFLVYYADFSGRSRRSEYWWCVLFITLIGGLLESLYLPLGTIWSLAVFIPSLAILVRRLHDTGRSGWWLLLNMIPLFGFIILIVILCQDSVPDNQWGDDPKK